MTEDRWTASDWERLGTGVRDGRSAMGDTQEEFVARVNELVGKKVISTSTLRKIENAKQTSFDHRTLPATSRALGWGPHGWEAVLDGADPRQLGQPAHAVAQRDYNSAIPRIPESAQAEIDAIIDEHVRKQQS